MEQSVQQRQYRQGGGEVVKDGTPLLPYFASLSRMAEYMALRASACDAAISPLAPKELTRCMVQGPSGPQLLSVPVAGGNRSLRGISYALEAAGKADSVALSEHGNWRHCHIAALRTDYSSAPFFLHYFPLVEEAILSSSTLGELLRKSSSAILAAFPDQAVRHLAALCAGAPSRAEALRLPLAARSSCSLSALDAIFRFGPDAIFLLAPAFYNSHISGDGPHISPQKIPKPCFSDSSLS